MYDLQVKYSEQEIYKFFLRYGGVLEREAAWSSDEKCNKPQGETA